MTLTHHAVEELRLIHYRETGEVLSYRAGLELAHRLLRFASFALDCPMPKDDPDAAPGPLPALWDVPEHLRR